MDLLTNNPNLSIPEIAESFGVTRWELIEAQVAFLREKTKIVQLIHER